MNILNWFRKTQPTNYPKQQLTNQQKETLDWLDSMLVKTANLPSADNLVLHAISISLQDQRRWQQVLSAEVFEDFAYIPRSIAFFVEPDGTWVYVVGIRQSESCNHDFTLRMFIDLLTRTNAARVE